LVRLKGNQSSSLRELYRLSAIQMYLGSWLFSVGLAIATFSVSSAVVSLAILVFYRHVARYEERLLLRKFGDEYRKYQARVPMFAPFKFQGKRLARVMGSGPRSA
jgi:steroid 5-alpha reductase family enzyme